MEELFSKALQVNVRCRDCEERKANIRVTIELQLTTSPVHKRDLLVRLTDDLDPYFLFNLSISEEDFQSLKVQQGLLIDFASFPQKFIDLLNLCYSEQESDNPRFLLHLSCQSPVLEGPANFSVVETNAFKHLNHLSLRLIQGSDKEIKDYLAVCLSALKVEKQALETKLKKTEDDLSRQLSYAQQTLSEKTKELDKLRSEWTNQTSSLSSRHSQELQLEREKAVEVQSRLQQQTEQLRVDLESAHKKSNQQLHSRLTELEASCRELTERKYKNESAIRDLKIKLVGAEEECQRSKQQVLSLRRENSTLDTEVHEKERLVSQLQMRVAVLEQEIKDKEQLMRRTKEVLEATQQQKESVEENAESKELQIRKLEATVKSLSEELIKANGIIKKLQGEVRGLVGKIKVKNTVTVSQEKILQETSEKLKNTEKDLQSAQQQIITKDEQVSKLKEQLEITVNQLNESREVLKTNENGEDFFKHAVWYVHFVFKCMCFLLVLRGDYAGLDSKYFERRDDSIPIYGLSSNLVHRGNLIIFYNELHNIQHKQQSREYHVTVTFLHYPDFFIVYMRGVLAFKV
uniref:Spindle assembly abnormal protein 6 homolog n=1 Tax=Lates calcarifer TaxID=8187 RepID=A0A4W6BWM3_LATCA